MSGMIGRKLAHYEILEELGAGGMGREFLQMGKIPGEQC
jgi:hypothetical protein